MMHEADTVSAPWSLLQQEKWQEKTILIQPGVPQESRGQDCSYNIAQPLLLVIIKTYSLKIPKGVHLKSVLLGFRLQLMVSGKDSSLFLPFDSGHGLIHVRVSLGWYTTLSSAFMVIWYLIYVYACAYTFPLLYKDANNHIWEHL